MVLCSLLTGRLFLVQVGNPAVEKVIVKKLLGEDKLDKKTFLKEARIIQELKHPNIVKFKGICNNPFALILAYA